jgi:putative endonuclease
VYFVYILYCPVTELSYVGQTDNLILRYYRHRDGKSRWTSRMRDPIVVHWEAFDKRGEAMKREKYYKGGSGFRVRQELVNQFLEDGDCSSVG